VDVGLPRLTAAVLVAVFVGAALTACGSRPDPAPTSSHVVHPVSALSNTLSSQQRHQVLAVARSTATTTLPHARSAIAPEIWSSNVTRVVAAVGSLHDATAWKQPNTPWQLSNPREADHPVLVVQMFGTFQFSRLGSRESAGRYPKVVTYNVPEITYVISTLDGAHLSLIRGNSPPGLTPARTIFAR
jgi:hypothetical protein